MKKQPAKKLGQVKVILWRVWLTRKSLYLSTAHYLLLVVDFGALEMCSALSIPTQPFLYHATVCFRA